MGYGSIVKVNINEYNLYYRCIVENNEFITSAQHLNIDTLTKTHNVTRMYTQGITCIDKLNNNLDIIHPNLNIIKDDNLDENFNNVVLKENCASHNLSFFYDENPNEKIKFKGIGGLVFNINEIKNFSHVTGFDQEYFNTVPKELITTKSLHENAVIIPKSYSDKYRMNGLYLYESKDGINWKLKQDTPIIGGLHDGLLSLRNGYNEFDSNICCFYWKKFNKYFLYTRANISNGKRFIQVTTSKNLIKWKPFALININPSYEYTIKENYYAYNIFEICDGEYLLAFIPYCEYTFTTNSSVKNNVFRIAISSDGFNFNVLHDISIFGINMYYPLYGHIKNNNIINVFLFERIHFKDYLILENKLGLLWNTLTSINETTTLPYEKIKILLTNELCDFSKNVLPRYYIDYLLKIFEGNNSITYEQFITEIYKFITCITKYEIDIDEISYLYTNDDIEKFVLLKDLYQFPSNMLELNCSIESNGYIIVELLDENFNVIKHYSKQNFDKITTSCPKRLCTWLHDLKITPDKYYIKFYLLNAKLISLDGLEIIKRKICFNAIKFTVIYYDRVYADQSKYINCCDPQIDFDIKNSIQYITKKLDYSNITKLIGCVKYFNNETKCIQSIKLSNKKIVDIVLLDCDETIRICNLELIFI
jgi:hypothetical protein